MSPPLARHEYSPGQLPLALEFLKRTRWELRSLRMVRVYRDRMLIFDVNHDCFEICRVGYPDADIKPLLFAVNAAFDPVTIHDSTEAEYKEFFTGRRHAWAEDRVM